MISLADAKCLRKQAAAKYLQAFIKNKRTVLEYLTEIWNEEEIQRTSEANFPSSHAKHGWGNFSKTEFCVCV